jgi:CRP/FNR family transcriptional regulator
MNDKDLTSLPMVRFLSDELRGRVLDAGFARTLSRGQVLFHEGDAAETMFAVVEGSVKMVRYTAKGKELLLHLVHPGQTFAEAAMFGDRSYPATAVAVSKTNLWCWPRAQLSSLARQEPDLGLAMAASVSLWTRRLAQKLELLTQRRVEERLAVYLLSRTLGAELVSGTSIELMEPKNLIAAQCGTAPEVLSRTFKRLEEEGVLKVLQGSVKILDATKLKCLAEWIE